MFGAGASRLAIEYFGQEVNAEDMNFDAGISNNDSEGGFELYKGKNSKRKGREILKPGGTSNVVCRKSDVQEGESLDREESEAKKLKMEVFCGELVAGQGDISRNDEVSSGVISDAPFTEFGEGSQESKSV